MIRIRSFVVALVFVALTTPAFAQVSTTQMHLFGSPGFVARVQYLAMTHAIVVKGEALNTVCHVKRSAYADQVLQSLYGVQPSLIIAVVGGINLTSAMVTGTAPNATSAATDAAIFSQIATFWNALSGCDTGS